MADKDDAKAKGKDDDKAKGKDDDKAKGKGDAEAKGKDDAEGSEGDAEGDEAKGKGDEAVGNDGKNSDGKCVGEDSCIMRGVADKLITHKKMQGLDQMAKEKFRSMLKNGWGALNDKAKCVSMVTKELPNVVPNMIEKIGSSTSGAIDNVSNSIKNLFDQVSGQEIKGYPDIFGPFEVGYAMIIIKIQNIINQIVLGSDADKILADPNIKSGELLDKMMRTSKRYKDAVEQAEFKNIFEEWMKNYVDALLKTLDIAQPEIDRINKRLSSIIEGMGENIGESISHALVNVISAIVSNIPGVGGIVKVILSADELGQELIDGCRPLAKAAGSMATVVDGVNKQISKTQCNIDELSKKLEPVLNIGSSQAGGGGGGVGRKRTTRKTKERKRKLNNTTRRIKYMLGQFKCKKNSKPNYTRRIMNCRRCYL